MQAYTRPPHRPPHPNNNYVHAPRAQYPAQNDQSKCTFVPGFKLAEDGRCLECGNMGEFLTSKKDGKAYEKCSQCLKMWYSGPKPSAPPVPQQPLPPPPQQSYDEIPAWSLALVNEIQALKIEVSSLTNILNLLTNAIHLNAKQSEIAMEAYVKSIDAMMVPPFDPNAVANNYDAQK
jgi:hypothetical protein